MKTARLLQIGASQAVRLPKDFCFSGDSVCVEKMGTAVVLLPYDDPWEPLRESPGLFSDDSLAERNQPATQERGRERE